MAFSHSKNTVIRLASGAGTPVSGTGDISIYCDNSSFPRIADVQDLTTYGNNSKIYGGALKDSTFTMGGPYDNASSNTPRVLLESNAGTTFTIVRRPEGTGVGKPQEVFNAVLKNYTETNAVADYVKWTAEFQCTGDINFTSQ